MAGTINPGDTCAAIKTIIEADLAAILDSLDTEHSATGAEVLDDIAKVWLAPQARHQASNLPALGVFAAGTRWRQDLGEQEAVYVHTIVLEVLLRGNDRTSDYAPEELLTVKLERTVRGIIETLEAKRQLTISAADNCDYLAFERASFGETVEADESRIEKRAEMSFLVRVSV